MKRKSTILILLTTFFIFNLSAKITEIPYTQLPTGQLVVELKIDGINLPQLFIVETSGGNYLRKDMNYRLHDLGLDTLETTFKFKQITIGDRVISNTKFKTKRHLGNRSEYAFPAPVIGTIGADLFNKLAIQFDFEKKLIRVADNIKELNIPEETNTIGFTQSLLHKTPTIDIEPWQYMRQPVELEVSIPVGINLSWNGPALEKRYRNKNSMTGYRVALDDVTVIDMFEQIVSQVNFDYNFVLYNVPITFCDDIRPIIGYQFLRHFVITFDFKGGKIYLQPITEEAKALFDNNK